MEEKNRIRGKKARSSGARFELKVRHDLESKGWVVDKWSNNVELEKMKYPKNIPPIILDPNDNEGKRDQARDYILNDGKKGKLIPSKHKFRGVGRPMAIGTGFPDFVAFRYTDQHIVYSDIESNLNFKGKEYASNPFLHEVIGVEVKSNGYLTKEEKEKCQWLISNDIFSKILIASKGKKRGEIVYIEFNQ